MCQAAWVSRCYRHKLDVSPAVEEVSRQQVRESEPYNSTVSIRVLRTMPAMGTVDAALASELATGQWIKGR